MTDEAVLDAQRDLWSSGDYPAIARHLLPISIETLDLVDIAAGDRLLDVGVGNGNTAVEAARRGALVTGVDISPRQLDLARARAAAERVSLTLHEGDAERLPAEDGAFDLVVSVLGVIFAPDHVRATAELARACRPGGTVAVVAWANDGWFQAWRARAARLVPPAPPGGPAGPRPEEWGEPGETVRRLAAAGLDASAQVRPFHWSFPSSEVAATFFLTAAGAFVAFERAATAAGHGDEVRPELIAALEETNEATDGTCVVPAPYLVALARR